MWARHCKGRLPRSYAALQLYVILHPKLLVYVPCISIHSRLTYFDHFPELVCTPSFLQVMATASAASAAEAARLAELEAAQRAAAAAQESELGLLRRQKAEAEERGRHQEAQVRGRC